MLPFEDRYTRQRRLEEVGPEGQRRLERSALVLAEHADVELEQDYLERAGVRQLARDAALPALEFPWPQHFQFEGAAGVARGAWSALARIRSALALERSGGGA